MTYQPHQSEDATLKPVAACWCRDCHKFETVDGWPWNSVHFVVCPSCGCKRCPHASNHTYPCTGTTGKGGHTCSGCEESRKEQTRSHKLAAAGFTRRPSAKALPPDE